jgi:hypothetical protein
MTHETRSVTGLLPHARPTARRALDLSAATTTVAIAVRCHVELTGGFLVERIRSVITGAIQHWDHRLSGVEGLFQSGETNRVRALTGPSFWPTLPINLPYCCGINP